MSGKFTRGWSLLKESWNVLRLDKELMLFPVLSFITCLVVLATFLSPLLFDHDLARQVFNKGARGAEGSPSALYYVGLFVFYFVSYFIVVFFNTALISCALIRFKGGNPTLGDGLRAARSRLPQIAAWALVAATVGMILRAIEERVSWVGKLVVGMIGIAWTVVTYLVVPILAAENLGPFDAIRRSTALLRKTWGESLVGQFSLGIVNLVLAIPGILLFGLGVLVAGGTGSLLAGLAVMVVGVVYLMALAIAISTVQQIFLAGAYLFAATGSVPQGFSDESMNSAFAPKR